jgi:hypothetical protein
VIRRVPALALRDTADRAAGCLQPAAVHGDQFAFSSSLAIFVHASDSYRLLKLLAQQTQHINAICWSPVDAKLIACSNAEKVRCLLCIGARPSFRMNQ